MKNSRISEEADTSDQSDSGVEPGKFGVVDFSESAFTTFSIVEGIDLGLDGLLLVDGRWKGRLFLSGLTHFLFREGAGRYADRITGRVRTSEH